MRERDKDGRGLPIRTDASDGRLVNIVDLATETSVLLEEICRRRQLLSQCAVHPDVQASAKEEREGMGSGRKSEKEIFRFPFADCDFRRRPFLVKKKKLTLLSNFKSRRDGLLT